MTTEIVESLIEGGKATAAPPLGPALGPHGVNIGEVVSKINEKTASFKGMQVPIKVKIDTDSKEFSIEVGTPPTSALIKKEAGVAKGAANPKTDKVADLKIEQIIKIGKMKEDSLLGNTMKEKVKEIIGTCNSMGILVEGVPAVEAIAKINKGKFAKEIEEEKTELSAEELKELEEEKKKLAEEMKEKHDEFVKQANEVLGTILDKETREKRKALVDAEIPQPIIDELVPEEKEEGAAAAPASKEGENNK